MKRIRDQAGMNEGFPSGGPNHVRIFRGAILTQ